MNNIVSTPGGGKTSPLVNHGVDDQLAKRDVFWRKRDKHAQAVT